LWLRLIRLDSICYFWRSTGGLAGTKRALATDVVLAPGLSGFKPHRRANCLPWNHNHKKRW